MVGSSNSTKSRLTHRGELEITDVNNHYIERANHTHELLEGWWTDAGTFESPHRANCLVARRGTNKVDEPPSPAPRLMPVGAGPEP